MEKEKLQKIKINIVGNIIGSDGYTSHTRGLINSLYKIVDCRLTTQLCPGWEKLVTDAELDMITKPERKDDWNIVITIPHMWKMFLGTGKNACYCVWEGDKIPVSWIEEMLNPKVDLVFVPSNHTKQAIWKTYWNGDFREELSFYNPEASVEMYEKDKEFWNKIIIIPHGIDKSIFYKTNKEKQNDKFVFYSNKGWRGTTWDRGGVQYILKAFVEEFSKQDKVELKIKLNPAYINPQIIKQSIEALNLPENRAPIQIICDNMPPKQLCDLYNQADCFVCATRAESFNLPGLEAMACGLPTMQTAFGGQVDYMTSDNSKFIDWTLVESEEKPAYEGICWAVPLISSIRKQMRWAFEHQEDIKQMGKQAEEDSKKWTWDCTSQKIIKILNETI